MTCEPICIEFDQNRLSYCFEIINRLSSKQSHLTDYKLVILQQDVMYLADPFITKFNSKDEFELHLRQFIQLWELQRATVNFYSSLIRTYVGSLSTRELYLLLWSGTLTTSDVHKRLRKSLFQIQDSERFRNDVADLEELVMVGVRGMGLLIGIPASIRRECG